MKTRQVLLVLGALVLSAANDAPAPPPPAVLAPYIHDGRFDPGDYGWMKGAYEDASEQEKKAYMSIFPWSTDCLRRAAAEVRKQLAEMGYPDAKIGDFDQGPVICRSIAIPYGQPAGSFAAFQQDLAAVKPVFDGYLLGVHVADYVASPGTDGTLADQIEQHTVADQMLRHAVSWGLGPTASAPELSQAGKDMVKSRLFIEIAARDHLNTEWLKQVVAEHGWPKISEVGKSAAGAAWLLAQHADADPVFQVKVLHLMEPMVAAGEADPHDYALLYDRVMLKLAGAQRYGTQFECRDGHFVPRQLEDAAKVEQWRKQAGLDTLADNQARIRKDYGACQS